MKRCKCKTRSGIVLSAEVVATWLVATQVVVLTFSRGKAPPPLAFKPLWEAKALFMPVTYMRLTNAPITPPSVTVSRQCIATYLQILATPPNFHLNKYTHNPRWLTVFTIAVIHHLAHFYIFVGDLAESSWSASVTAIDNMGTVSCLCLPLRR